MEQLNQNKDEEQLMEDFRREDEELLDRLVDTYYSNFFVHASHEDIGDQIVSVCETYQEEMEQARFHERWNRAWRYYNGLFDETRNGFVGGTYPYGETGQLTKFETNQMRSVIQTVIGIATSNPPNFDVRAVNSDSTSLQLATLGRTILDYYVNAKDLGAAMERVVEHAFIYDAGYIAMEWDPFLGKEFSPEQELQGDVKITTPMAYDVFFDPYKNSWEEQDWVIVRSWIPRQELESRFYDEPETFEAIKNAKNKTTSKTHDRYDFHQGGLFRSFNDDLNDDVEIFTLYHRKTNAVPDGRCVKVLSSGHVLVDTPLHYYEIPVKRFAISEFAGTPFARSPIQELMSSQDALNTINSTIISNQTAFGLQIIAVPSSTEINPQDFSRGIVLLKYNEASAPPQGINLTATAPELFTYREQIMMNMNDLLGISPVSRGQTGNLQSGSALALSASMSAQNLSPFLQNYTNFQSDVATTLLRILKEFAHSERTISILGKHSSGEQVFSSRDLVDFDRVIVEPGNPLTISQAGKSQVASELLAAGLIGAEDFLQVLATGNLDAAISDDIDELSYIKTENEYLLEGTQVSVNIFDNHELHIKHHVSLLNRPEFRINVTPEKEAIMAVLQEHVMEHMQLQAQVGGMSQPQPPQQPPQQIAPQPGQPAGPGVPTAMDAGVVAPSNPTNTQAAAAGTTQPRMPTNPMNQGV